MPKKDGTGPCGKGPKTGRGMGSCSQKDDEKRGDGRLPRRGRVGRRDGMCTNSPAATEKTEE